MPTHRAGWATYWGVFGFLALLTQANLRLAPLAVEAIESGLTGLQWALMLGYSAFMAYSEGYKGFYLNAAPRAVARGVYLAENPTAVRLILAPLFCMGLFGATRRRLVISWSLVVMIVTLIVLVRMLPQPWRGIVDAGVVLGLMIGSASIVYFLARAAFGRAPNVDPEAPAPSP